MDAHLILLDILLILVFARILGDIARYFSVPSVIGELCAGILIGPSLFGWVEINSTIFLLGEIGVILLLFEVGIETNLNKLVDSGKNSTVVAIGGFLGPFLGGFFVCYWWFDISVLVSLFVGGTLTATSIGITVRTLGDLGRQQSQEGQITLGAAVLDDIMGVILLAVLYDFSVNGSVDLYSAGRVILFVGIFFILAPVLAKIFSEGIYKLDRIMPGTGAIPTAIVALVLFFAWLAHLFGAPELLGGFAAGLALSKRFFLPFGMAVKTSLRFSEKVETQIDPIVKLFTPIFFVSVGLSMDLGTVDWSSPFFWWFSILVLVIAIFTKFTGALFIKGPISQKIAIGMSMVPRGEVGLIFAGLGASANIFTNEVYTALVMVIAYTTLLSPFWLKLYYSKYGHLLSEQPGLDIESLKVEKLANEK